MWTESWEARNCRTVCRQRHRRHIQERAAIMQEFSEDPALVQEFITESEELLQSMDQDMVQLESTPEDDELLNRIFRALHTIKGTSGFLGYDPIVKLGHRAED